MRAVLLERINETAQLPGINLAFLDIKANELVEIIETIHKLNPGISTIDLDGNQIGDEGARILRSHLEHFKQLSELSIQYNNIGKDGALEVFGLKSIFKDLDILFCGNQDISVNELDDIVHLATTRNSSFKLS